MLLLLPVPVCSGASLFTKGTVFVPEGCHSRKPQTRWLKATETYGGEKRKSKVEGVLP